MGHLPFLFVSMPVFEPDDMNDSILAIFTAIIILVFLQVTWLEDLFTRMTEFFASLSAPLAADVPIP